VTQWLRAWGDGLEAALHQLVPLVESDRQSPDPAIE
jgi:hypothetical protein